MKWRWEGVGPGSQRGPDAASFPPQSPAVRNKPEKAMIFDSFRSSAFGVQASTSIEHWGAERDTQTDSDISGLEVHGPSWGANPPQASAVFPGEHLGQEASASYEIKLSGDKARKPSQYLRSAKAGFQDPRPSAREERQGHMRAQLGLRKR
ncbi:hypothetical protein MC885_016444 [Smutsia gigantea]|nr:hypothetical protein MC885_016444 [Smutsia gigantea]